MTDSHAVRRTDVAKARPFTSVPNTRSHIARALKGYPIMSITEPLAATKARYIAITRSLPRALRKTLTVAFTALITFAWFSTASLAQQSGGLDTALYGPYLALAYGQYPETTAQEFWTHDAIVLPDDRVVASGTCVAAGASPAGTRFCLAVWSANGASVALYVHSTSINRVSASARGAIAQQADGKIVVTAPCTSNAGFTINQFCTVRFNADFTSDTTFSPGFLNVAPSPSTVADSFPNAIAIQPDGKIVIAGQCGSTTGVRFCAARLRPDGSPDSTFGGANSLRTYLGVHSSSESDRVASIALTPDGKIYLGGTCKQDVTSLFRPCVSRLNTDGSIDTGFSGATPKPLLLPPMSGGSTNDWVADMVVQANGEFVFAGSCSHTVSTARVPCALRMGAPNAIQFTTGTWYLGSEEATGTSIWRGANGSLLEPETFSRIFFQPDGKMLALTERRTGVGPFFQRYELRRYNEDGSRDANWKIAALSFKEPGSSANNEMGVAIGRQSNGRVLVVGGIFVAPFVGPINSRQARVIGFENRPEPARNCSADIDGDGKVMPTTDGLLLARASLGMTGNAVISGAVGAGALRSSWTAIRDFLITQCGMKTIVP
ncbi:MAG: hypothetical protein EAZ43_04740 [Betaproteobacteria bacterium]|nr:MAG: hypothetical protein EAZ43_04740 [Betaproteobacteria bacterium]